MRRHSQDSYDEEAARREPLLGDQHPAAAAASRQPPAAGEEGGGVSRGASPARALSPDHLPRSVIRLTRRSSTLAQDQEEEEQRGGTTSLEDGGLVLKDVEEEPKDGYVRELEVEVVAGAVAEAVAEAVQEAVQEAVHDAVQQAIEENVQFDVRANVYTLIAVTGVILFWRGVWNTWDSLFGTELESNVGSMVVGLVVMCVIRALDLPLVQGLPGG